MRSPRYDFSSVTLVGLLASMIASMFCVRGLMPFWSIQCPRNSSPGRKKMHLAGFSLIPWSCKRPKTSSKIWKCSSGELPEIRMSSIRHTVKFTPSKSWSIIRWQMAGALETPNGKRLYRYNPSRLDACALNYYLFRIGKKSFSSLSLWSQSWDC